MLGKSFAVVRQPWLERPAFDEIAWIMKDSQLFTQVQVNAMYKSFEKWQRFSGLRLYCHIKSKATDSFLATILTYSHKVSTSDSKSITT